MIEFTSKLSGPRVSFVEKKNKYKFNLHPPLFLGDCHSAHVEVSSVHLSCGMQGLNSGRAACNEAPLCVETSHYPQIQFLSYKAIHIFHFIVCQLRKFVL